MKIKNAVIPVLLVSLFFCCNNLKPASWPENNAVITAVSYALPLADSSLLLTHQGEYLTLLEPDDSLISKSDTLCYRTPKKGIQKFFKGNTIATAKTYSSNPAIEEYYTFDKGAVKLAGYATSDSLMPVTVFSNPLVIFPGPGFEADSTFAIKQNWSTRENAFVEDTKTRTVVKQIKTGTLLIEGQPEAFVLYQLALAADAKVGFGEQQLIVPDAIYMQSYMVVGNTKGLIGEWSIKTKRTQADPTDPQNPIQPENSSYIEYISYNPITQ
jgi:hypothetical protein